MNVNPNTRRMVESAILLAVGFILSMLKFAVFPQGGSVTVLSMLPLVILGYKYGPLWGGLCGFLHSLLQILEGGGVPAPPVQDFGSYLLVILLDYVLAWMAVGVLAGLVAKGINRPRLSICVGALVGIGGRYLCSFLSGIVIWGIYAPEGQSVAVYSLLYNGSYMVPEMVITAIGSFVLFSFTAMRNAVRKANAAPSVM